MFGKPSKRWIAETAERGLTPVPDASQWVGVELDTLRPVIERSLERRRILMPNGSPVRYESTRTTKVIHSSVNSSLHRAGLLAAFQVKSSYKTRSPNSFHYDAKSLPKGQVLVGRLARSVGGHLFLEPHYSPTILEGFESKARQLLGDDLAPFRLEHPLLQHWFLEMWGTIEAQQLAADPGLCALLWALRPKVSGADVHVEDLAAQYEALIPACERHYSSATVEIHDDIIALYRHHTVRGLDDDMADQVQHVTRHFV
jgi:hypothetical protein